MTGIVILNYNNPTQTLACLDSIRGHCPEGTFRVCIVDNASSDDSVRILSRCPGATVLPAETNGGYAKGNNIGLKFLSEDDDIDTLLILNDDTRLTMDVVNPMRKYLLEHEECGVVFPLVLAPDGSIDRACARKQKTVLDLVIQATSLGKLGIKRKEFLPTEGLRSQREVHTQVPPGSCMMLRREVFESIGFLDEETFLYFEEHILCEKLRRKGLGCVLLPQLEIIHLGAQTTKKQPSKTIYGHWRDSYLYFMREYSSVPVWLQKILALRTALRCH